MQTQDILIDGQTSIESLTTIVGPFIDGIAPSETEHGLTYASGLYSITDAELDGLYYEDDLGIPFSHYRFAISTRITNGREWASHVFEALARQADLDLLWVDNMQHFVQERTVRAKIAVGADF